MSKTLEGINPEENTEQKQPPSFPRKLRRITNKTKQLLRSCFVLSELAQTHPSNLLCLHNNGTNDSPATVTPIPNPDIPPSPLEKCRALAFNITSKKEFKELIDLLCSIEDPTTRDIAAAYCQQHLENTPAKIKYVDDDQWIKIIKLPPSTKETITQMIKGLYISSYYKPTIFEDEELPKLKRLSISLAPFTPKQMQIIGSLEDLEELYFHPGISIGLSPDEQANATIQNHHLPYLRPLTKLSNLGLRESAVSNRGIEEIATHLPSLSYLDLRDTNVTDGCLDYLALLPNLSALNLSHTRVTGARIATLLPQLTYLDLGHTNITEKGLEALLGLPNLKYIDVICTPIDPTALTKLIIRHPHIEIRNSVIRTPF